MRHVQVFDSRYTMFRPIGGANSNKFNRAAKLLNSFEELSTKFDRMIERGNGISDTARMALAVKLLMYTGIRIGNEGSAEGYMTVPHPNSKVEAKFVKTYGLTTLLPEHIIIAPRRVCINFLGKRQVENSFELVGTMAKQLKQLYKWSDVTLFDISAVELTKFIKRHVGSQFTPKDFRTMRANMYASEMIDEICQREEIKTKREFNAEIKEIATYVAGHLNNTPGVCKKSYIDPIAWEYHSDNRL